MTRLAQGMALGVRKPTLIDCVGLLPGLANIQAATGTFVHLVGFS